MIDFKKFKFIVSFSSSGDLLFTAREEVIDYEHEVGHDINFTVTYSKPNINDFEDLQVYFSDFLETFKEHKFKKIEWNESPTYSLF